MTMVMKRKALRKDRIKDKLKEILDTLGIVQDNLPATPEEFLQIGLVRDGIYKKIEYSIECVIDVCNIINSDLRLGTPTSEDDITENLRKNKILTEETIKIIEEMKRFRNILVHKYGEIDDKKAFTAISEGLEDFAKIINEIELFLKKNQQTA